MDVEADWLLVFSSSSCRSWGENWSGSTLFGVMRNNWTSFQVLQDALGGNFIKWLNYISESVKVLPSSWNCGDIACLIFIKNVDLLILNSFFVLDTTSEKLFERIISDYEAYLGKNKQKISHCRQQSTHSMNKLGTSNSPFMWKSLNKRQDNKIKSLLDVVGLVTFLHSN